MRYLCLLFGLILLPARASVADPILVLKREAGKCALAWQRQDFTGIISYLPPRVVVQSGGRAALLRELKDQFAQAKSLGVEKMEARPGRPSTPRQIGPWLTSLVPATAVLHGPHLDLTQRTQVLAISTDQGKRWFFLLLYQITQADLNKWFPEFAGKIIIPDEPAPQLEFAY